MGDRPPLTEMTATVSKTEALRDPSTDSLGSSPEPGLVEPYLQEEQQQQRRKGGRKPIYATSEERKQRNRQAQAAFRERRIEYIKQLESAIKQHEDTLQSLQNSHRSAADECLMLRYKNSLLERIMLEKGIDVQTELRVKAGSPNLGPVRASLSAHASPNQAPLQNRAALNRQHHTSSLRGPSKDDLPTGLPIQRSPMSQPITNPLLSSPAQPATRSPNFVSPGHSVSPNFASISASQQPSRSQPCPSKFSSMPGPPRSSPTKNQASSNGMAGASNIGSNRTSSARGNMPPSFYATQFSDHMIQLEQEYEDQADSYEHEEPNDHSVRPASLSQQPFSSSGSMRPPATPTLAQNPPFTSPAALAPNHGGHIFHNISSHLFDPYDPMLDADPFGLSASMQFPTVYESR